METCGTDWLCSIVATLGDLSSLISMHLFKIVFFLGFSVSVFLAGRGSLKTLNESYREGFINGIQYYVNVDAFNEAKIPHKINADADNCIKEAQSRVAKNIRPVAPPKCS